MTECKRVLLDKNRIVIILLMFVVMLCLFAYDFLGGLRPHIIEDNLKANDYAEYLISNCEGKTFEQIEAYLTHESERLWQDDTDQSGIEYLASQTDDRYNQVYRLFSSRFGYIKAEADHQAAFDDYLLGVEEQAKLLSSVGIFNQSGGFSNKNITKTAADFASLDGMTLTLGNSYGIDKWLRFELADCFFLGGIIIVIVAFLEERKLGLWSVIRTTKHGRSSLTVKRMGILALASVILTALFYALPLLISLTFTDSFSSLERPMQSLECFSRSTLTFSVGEWLIRYLTLKILCGILLGMIIWAVMSSVTNVQFSLGVVGTVFAAEYLLYALLPVQSFANIFKYLNIFSYVNSARLYTQYLNINIFGIPVGIRDLSLIFLPILLMVFAVVCLLSSLRYSDGNRDLLSKLSLKINNILDALRCRLSVFGWELYKVLIYSFGIVVIVGAFLVGSSLSFDASLYEKDRWYQAYLTDIQGKITAETQDYFATARANADNAYDYYELHLALDRLELEVADITARAEADGYTPYIIDPKPFLSIYGDKATDIQRLNASVAILFVCLGCASVAVYEQKSGVNPLLKSLKNGRGYLLIRKILVCLVMAIAVWVCIYGHELADFFSKGKVFLSAPIRNISELSGYPLNITIGGLLSLIYSIRLISLMAVSLCTLLISHYSKSIVSAYVASVGILALPSFGVTMGIEVLRYVSFCLLTAAGELIFPNI